MRKQRAHAEGAHDRQARVQTLRPEPGYLIERARCHHQIEAAVAAAVEFVTRGRNHIALAGILIEDGRAGLCLPVGERAAGGVEHFEGADDALRVGSLETGRHHGIFVPEHVMKGGRAETLCLPRQCSRISGRGSGTGRKARQQCPEIETCSADDDGQCPLPFGAGDFNGGLFCEAGSGIGLAAGTCP